MVIFFLFFLSKIPGQKITLCKNNVMDVYVDNNSYNIISEDKNIEIRMYYDTKGLQLFSLIDKLSNIEIIFNYDYYGEDNNKALRSYQYKDNNYHITANLLEQNDPYLIEKIEVYKGIGKKYYLYKNAKVKIIDLKIMDQGDD
jgi:hypothetical protein